ncbi:LEAF RUST 10 DISEASE-RESISTANCE LOCUS RECEPTOR-LIKE PROTEIN KINASE-like 1.5 [Neltuma alba]|uniref:LEAF RUST 10 DISEASE-RESISTANCE LOCUS RECEPTOR-LIKE PROTEIN KINASE-like 1.5 n=1 Tax=Neltuma alba TaxID=207710 RepID=UPI0010A33753|nr:LEAF RUST 10 DISEASE-RESISTANCE LOCUS RECEPTOR-LIKE PROTEIN KINASE-like 1.5 [Prosopis alba]
MAVMIQVQTIIDLDKNNGRKKLRLLNVSQKNIITVSDEDLDKILKSKGYCQVFDTNQVPSSSPPNSALVSFEILNHGNLIKCSHCDHVHRPAGFSKHVCSDFDVYWEDSSSQIVIQVRLSHDCDKCHNHLGGQCLLDANDKFYCKYANRGLLPWLIRIKIAIETATALAYLHASDIIHCDVKTNNILLENNFCVKVVDFGLSRLFPNAVTHVSTASQGKPRYYVG